jgi:hypothetical protein
MNNNTLGMLMQETKSLRCSMIEMNVISVERDKNQDIQMVGQSILAVQDQQFHENTHLEKI